MQHDIIAIGDTVIDAFIRLQDASVVRDATDTHDLLAMRFGEKIPFEFDSIIPGVGNSANAAVACARLGLNAGLHTYVGDDHRGDDCIESLKKEGVQTDLIVKQEGKKTNYHYVLWYESERTILIKHEAYEYSMPDHIEPPQWIYLSSMANKSLPYHEEIARYLLANSQVKLAFQPGTFQIKMGTDALKDLYARTEIFFCNKEEAQQILKTESTDWKELLAGMQSLGVKIPVITDGRNGAYTTDTDGSSWHIPMYPDPKPPYERTGAGDASASTTVAYVQMGYPIHEAIMRGAINSMSVVQEVGAQKGLLTKEQIEEWYAKRQPDFIASRI
jgi:ribokinase